MMLSFGAKRKVLQASTYLEAHATGRAMAFYQNKYNCTLPEAQQHIVLGVEAVRGFEAVGFTASDIQTLAKEVGL